MQALLDQHGMPIPPKMRHDTRAKGAGGGYKKVDDNGHGKKTFRDYDPMTGILRIIHFDGEGGMITKKFQNLDALGTLGKTITEGFQKHKKTAGGLQQQCVIGNVAYYDIMRRCGWDPRKSGAEYDKKKFDQIINDQNEPGIIRTRPGKLSCQRRDWY